MLGRRHDHQPHCALRAIPGTTSVKLETRLICRRWFEIAAYALIAVSVVLLARSQLLEFWHQWVRPRRPVEQAAVGFLTFVLLLGLGRGQWAGCLRFRRWHRYPPHLVSVLLGLALLWIAQSFQPGTNSITNAANEPPDNLLRAGVFLFCALASVVWTSASTQSPVPAPRLPPSGTHADRRDPGAVDFQKLVDWVSSDNPLTDIRLDRYGHRHVADRIAQRLIENSSNAIILIGPVGSGKTTIGALTERRLEERRPKNRTIRFVRTSLWPFAFSDSAIEGILGHALECLRAEADTLAISGVPEAYSQAVSSDASGFAGVLKVIHHKNEPGELLDRINDIATTAGIEIVLWIEDLERYGGNQERALARPPSQIHSLLYELSSRSAIRVVVASSTILDNIDPAKIARYIEHVPKIGATANWTTISAFRNGCLSQTPNWIDAADTDARARVATLRAELSELIIGDELYRQNIGARAALAVAASTPRELKLGLRRALEVWQTLRGEVDFDDTLAMSLVAAVSPRTFSFVDEHIDRLRNGPPRSIGQPNKADEKRDAEFLEGLEDALSSVSDLRSRTAVRALIDFVFPTASVGAEASTGRPQGFASGRPRDYWRRFTAQAPVNVGESDQAVLSAVVEWESGSGTRLLAMICDEIQSDATGVFGRLLSEDRVYGCLKSICVQFSTNTDVGVGFISSRLRLIRDMLYGRSRRLSVLANAAAEAIGAQGAGDLRVAFAIVETFAYDRDNWYLDEHDDGYREQIKLAARQSLVESCAAPETEARRLGMFMLDPLELYRLVRATSLHTRGPIRSMPFEDWPVVASALVTASQRDFSACMPYLLGFTTTTRESIALGGSEAWQVVDRFVVETLFDPVLISDLLSKHPETPAWSFDNQKRLSVLRSYFDDRTS